MVQRNGVFENMMMTKKKKEEEEVISACVQEGRASRGCRCSSTYWDRASWLVRGRGGWTRRRSCTLSIVYSDGEKDMRFRLSEWLWSVSAVVGMAAGAGQRNKTTRRWCGRQGAAQSVPRWCSPKAAVAAVAGKRKKKKKKMMKKNHRCLPYHPPCFSSFSSSSALPDSSGVLKYEDAFLYWTYEHDRWRDPFIGDVGGNAYQIASDRWRHAFHHMPNRCPQSSCQGSRAARARGRRRRRRNSAAVSCATDRDSDEYVLGASPSFAAGGVLAVALGCCCLRKLEAIIALYKALQDVRALREKPQPGSGNSFASTTDDDDDVFEAVRGPVDRFNRAVDELDQAMGMDQQYRVYGSSGGGFYNVGPFGDEA